jgi:REP element-mobilizing transposase RayT
MKYDPDIHHRRSIRLREYDYSANGAYFVTICTEGRECLFGEILNATMLMNDAGRMVVESWLKLPDKFPGVELDEFVCMPNHFHGILVINANGIANVVGALLAAPMFPAVAPMFPAAAPMFPAAAPLFPTAAPLIKSYKSKAGAASSAPTLGQMMRVFKSISAIDVNRALYRQGQPLWQRNYYERVIRNDVELSAVREYIQFNPANWAEDEEYSGYA